MITLLPYTENIIMKNVINWFEIPALDFERAMKFYSQILEVKMEEMPSPDGIMRYGNFTYDPEGSVVSGGIVHMTEPSI